MPNYSPVIENVLQALGDPTRRAVFAQLCKGPATVSDLAAPFKMALPSFVQHLRVLEDSGLMTSSKKGRVRTCRARLTPLTTLEKWIADQRSMWGRRLDQFDEYVTALYEEEKNK